MPKDRDDDSNVIWTPRPRKGRRIETKGNITELRDYFERRRQRLEIVATTQLPTGQVLDWIPRDSQAGGKVAEPPPLPIGRKRKADQRRSEYLATASLEEKGAERGPKGTVPIARRNLEALHSNLTLKKYLSKTRGHRVLNLRGMGHAMPEEDGNHRYASSGQGTTAFGAEGDFSCFDPWLESTDDFSLIQMGLSNSDLGFLQTVEAGWQESEDIYGDWIPHLFVYYTTNGYTDDDDCVGGYNTEVDGWIQHDDVIFPETTFTPYSTRGGDQHKISIKYQLFRDNWWLSCQGRWVGYYSARLFMGNQSVFSTLGDHADHVGFWGEIYDSDDVAGRTKSDMGSGNWPSSGWTWSAYMHDLRYQSDRAGGMTDYDGTGQVYESDPDMYAVDAHFTNRGAWRSFMYLGGPGAG